MPLGLRLSLLLLIAGCAEGLLAVPDSDWNKVPAAQRAAIDRQYDAELAAARAELKAASASLAALPRTQPAPPRARATATATAAAGDPGDVWAAFLRDREKARGEALDRVEAAAATVQRTDASWRQLRVDTADARLAMLASQRELLRAQAVNRSLPGDESYDSAPIRGQFSQAQRRWYAVASRARAARDAFERASRDLASAKEAYAQLMRAPSIHLPEPALAADDHGAPLALSGWSIARSDIRRRRGLRHFLDEALASPQLRTPAYRLSPPPRSVALALAAAAAGPTAASAAPAAAAASPARPAAPAAAAASAGKPAAPAAAAASPARPAAPAAAAARPGKPAAPAAAAASPGKPAAPAAAAASPGKPAAPAAAAAPPVEHPADRAAAPALPAATAPTRPAAPAPAAASSGKSAAPAAAARAPRPATSAAAAGTVAKPAATSAAAATPAKPPAPGSNAPSAVDHPAGRVGEPAAAVGNKPAPPRTGAPAAAEHPADRATR